MGDIVGAVPTSTLQLIGILVVVIIVSTLTAVVKDAVKSKFFSHNPNFNTIDEKLDRIIVLLARIDERTKKGD